ncbi:uncharacterized protein Z520_12176 [Fonsecaea multimorphosa CBS 102226]|uniref:Alpha/beta hydrolase fold-3 domain-containing protein n=1 Tax=Fonsecaea multimorphosa CBS 102226 TaxID=1442371 RepID=A0A0D2JG10_9EURO|nr:uncharacterized protein Z520_12176 [Fonsecaea multimorphosa CBS 102226]KIX92092.1 hypothetical protein Z520_12176 [Fonsecaea multimorphosa CBS 102226]OAL17456.1 hypothetical protein AYO22_11588 [Fonsecaea multimorphosa]
METDAQSRDLSQCILVILLMWIFADGNVFDLSHWPAAGMTTPWDVNRIHTFITTHFIGRNLRWDDVSQQTSHLRRLLENPEYENRDSMTWTYRFNWLMNAAIVYVGAISGTVTRDFLKPRALPVEAMSRWLSRQFDAPFTVQDLEYHLIHWVIIFSGCAGEAQHNLNYSAVRVDWTMAKYLMVPLTPLAPNISGQFCGPYRRFHEDVEQWYPPRVWRNRITPMSPYDTKTGLLFNFDADTYDYRVSREVLVRQFVPLRNERRDMPVIVWFAGGGWMLGDISGDNNILSHISARDGAYRRQQFPIPHDDALEIANSVRNRVGRKDVVLAGVSSGGNLAAATALAWSAQGHPPAGLLLVAPSLDNTWECEERWRENWDAPWLTPEAMRFFQNRCFQGPGDRSRDNWRASPLYADQRTIESTRAFPTKVVAMAGDILCRESIDFVTRLEAANCGPTLSVFPYGHTGLLMQGIVGTALLEEMMDWIKQRANNDMDMDMDTN